MIKLEAKPTNIYIIQVHFPTTRSTEEDIEEMYVQVEELLQLTENNANIFITGDFNASVSCEGSNNSGKFGLENVNERGKRLIEFCKQHELIISNTYFEVPLRRHYTLKAPGNITRYQIDFILVKNKYKNQITFCYVYPGFDVDSDHNLVIAK
ncbi:craniofacial development protein 2-like [Sipha flava]|jgi:exonuclease III|uniref:Craniofacial development protein 2-like n=1 Tax=Sipha flava TaxID=143950 RepID=A0A8B8GRS1_9HEMI|nr:craniofacial development protein 2-like [Sipha flava]